MDRFLFRRRFIALAVYLQFSIVFGQNQTNLTCIDLGSVNTSSSILLPYFSAKFPDIGVAAPTRPFWLGGRNVTYCCMQALDEYLRTGCIDHGSIVDVEKRVLDPESQFPCGAEYIGEVAGAPRVSATYSWAQEKCPGWQVSDKTKINEWAQLLVAFILPAVVFSFNIPRPRKLRMWEKFFPSEIGSYKMVAGMGGALGSAIFVSIDTVLWLMVSFAFAGPLLLSGLYEAQLDKRILDYLQERIKYERLPLALRARILFTILCGNLDMYPAWSDTMDLATELDQVDQPTPAPAPAAPLLQPHPPQSPPPPPPDNGVFHGPHPPTLQQMLQRPTPFQQAPQLLRPPQPAQASSSSSSRRSLSQHTRSPSDRGGESEHDLGSPRETSIDDQRSTAPLQHNTHAIDNSTLGVPGQVYQSSRRGQEEFGLARGVQVTGAQAEEGEEENAFLLGGNTIDFATRNQDNGNTMRRVLTTATTVDGHEDTGVEFGGNRYSDAQHDRSKIIRKTAVRLRAMLSCQYSFGSTIGGPVVFFLGSFIYAILDLRANVGDENIAEALAFGMWWCVIPHVATVAGLLLAGNNPNILEGIVSIRELRYTCGANLTDRRLQRRDTAIDIEAAIRLGYVKPTKKSYSGLLERVYDAEYIPAWMWDRGKCKQDWLLLLFTDAWQKYENTGTKADQHHLRLDLERFLTEGVMLGIRDWVFLWFFAFVLVFIPCMFGFLIALFTPKIGIGCRASTFLVYMCAQICLLLLWTYYLTFRDRYWAIANEMRKILVRPRDSQSQNDLKHLVQALQRQASKDTSMPEKKLRRLSHANILNDGADSESELPNREPHFATTIAFRVACAILFLISLFTSIGGTLMQVMGVYRNNFCLLNTPDWTHARRADIFVLLSSNTSEGIAKAESDWIKIGSTSVTFLGVVCYLGWWYQRHLRSVFKTLASKLDGEQQDREMTDLNQRFPNGAFTFNN